MRALLFAALLLGGCAAGGYDGRQISGVQWRAVDINGIPVTGATPPTLLLQGGRATGSGGCNSFTGSFQTLTKARVRMSGISSTRMACDPAIMDQERRYLSILEGAEGYSFYADGSVSLISGDGRAIRFRRR